MAYIDAAKYNEMTGRPGSEATASRLLLASALLDARLGNYAYDATSGLKLNLAELSAAQVKAVELWVAYMVTGLFETNDTLQTGGSLKLGRFSEGVTANQVVGELMPDNVKLADAVLKASGLIRRAVSSRRFFPDREAGYFI